MISKWIGLLDCNNFFVSCERLFRPDLVGKPVVVLSSNDGCVIARSKEVKDIGIPMGVPYFQIKDIISANNITVFSGNHTLYRDISKRVFVVMAEELEVVEQYSVDEAFFTFRATEAEALLLARKVKDKVELLTGVPVSVGVAPSKTLAKVANALAKKSSETTVLNADHWQGLQHTYKLHEVWGIGRQLSQQLTSLGLHTVADYLQTDTAVVKQLFGVVGVRLQLELSGVFVPSRSTQSQQSIMSSRSFKAPSMDRLIIEQELAYHVEQVAFDLRRLGLKSRLLTVFLGTSRYGDFALRGKSVDRQLLSATSSTGTLVHEATTLLRELFQLGVPYTKTGVRVTDLLPQDVRQLDMFTAETNEINDTLQATLDVINNKSTTGRVHIGFLETGRKVTPRADARSPRYTTSWTELPKVKA